MNEINQLEGLESTQRKLELLSGLFKNCRSDDELRYIVRSFANTGLRIGLSSKSVEKCVLEYFDDEAAKKDSNLSEINTRIEDFESQIFGYRIQKLHNEAKTAIYNIPIKSMVGRSAKDVPDVLKLLGSKVNRARLSADFKYDGERT